MNGAHDMGGMHGHGRIPYATTEPVFHAPWEGRVNAMMRGLGAWGFWSLDAARHQIEQLPPAAYLSLSYYEKWLAMLEALSLRAGLVSAQELANGQAEPGAPARTPRLTVEGANAMLDFSASFAREPARPARFVVGDTVRARNINPTGHTRLPRYARGKTGVIARHNGAHVFPDSHAHGQGESPGHLYSVRFTARALWGEAANPRDTVHIDLWEDYLEPA